MSSDIEWGTAEGATAEVVERGEVGLALVLNVGTSVAIEGTARELLELSARITEAVAAADPAATREFLYSLNGQLDAPCVVLP